jgi:predicted amidophosphoribosyltransferase
MNSLCLRCGTLLPEGAKVCPTCGLNVERIRKTFGEFLPTGSLQVKIQNALRQLENQEITLEELEHRLQVEWQIVEALLEKYRFIRSAQLAPVAEILVRALALYQQALLALGEEGNSEKSLNLAREADDCLAEFDNAREQIELRYPRPEISG